MTPHNRREQGDLSRSYTITDGRRHHRLDRRTRLSLVRHEAILDGPPLDIREPEGRFLEAGKQAGLFADRAGVPAVDVQSAPGKVGSALLKQVKHLVGPELRVDGLTLEIAEDRPLSTGQPALQEDVEHIEDLGADQILSLVNDEDVKGLAPPSAIASWAKKGYW